MVNGKNFIIAVTYKGPWQGQRPALFIFLQWHITNVKLPALLVGIVGALKMELEGERARLKYQTKNF
jgi:hypothetical protein